jgi:hypothetical protein
MKLNCPTVQEVKAADVSHVLCIKEIKVLSGKWMKGPEIINLIHKFMKLKSSEMKMLQLFLQIPDCGTYLPRTTIKENKLIKQVNRLEVYA